LKQAVAADSGLLAAQVVEAATRRADSLLGVAIRSGKAAIGATAVAAAEVEQTDAMLVVAADAAAAAKLAATQRAVQRGAAVVYATKTHLGRVAGRNSIGVVAILDHALAAALRDAINLCQTFDPARERGQSSAGPA